jgi:hypothetical protein
MAKSGIYMTSRWLWPGILLVATVVMAAFGPLEQSLGASIRLVYLHGAWVWAGILVFLAASLAGLAALLTHRSAFFRWSEALGRTGLCFWLTYLPMSLLLMQIDWGGFFFDEPRWRIPFAYGVAGLLLQVGLALFDRRELTAAGNLIFGVALIWSLNGLQSILHPDSPILNSPSWDIRLFFAALLALALLLAWQVARLWLSLPRRSALPG